MADSLIDLPGSGASPVPCNPMRWRYPFRNNPVTPDIYSRVIERDYEIAALSYNYVPAPFTRNTFINLCQYSDTQQNAYYATNSALTVLDGFIRNPWDGTYTLAYLLETVATSGHWHGRSGIAISSGGTYCFSLFVLAAANGSQFQLYVDDTGATNGFYANFDSSTGTVVKVATALGAGSDLLAGVQDLGIIPFGHYYRMWVKGKINGGATSARILFAFIDSPAAGPTPSYAGTTRFCGAGGWQFESANTSNTLTPSTYLATTGANRTATLIPSSHAQIHPTDPVVDPFAICLMESDPAAGIAMLAGFTRSFARLPTPQIVPSSKFFTRPVMNDIFIASTAWAVCFDQQQRFSHVFTSRKSGVTFGAFTLGVTPGAQSFGTLPAINVTFTDSAGTGVTVNFSSGAASIAASLNGGLTVRVKNFTAGSADGSLIVGWVVGTGYMASIVTATGAVNMGWSPGGTSVTFTAADTRTAAPVANPSIRAVVCTGHGGLVGDRVAFWNGDRLVATSVIMVVTDADNFSCIAADVDGKDLVVTHLGISADAANCYVNGSKVCTTRKTTTFYLPGYSVGITTYADIPTQLTYIDALSWLGRISAVPTGWANIEVAEVTQWMGAILQQEITEIQMDDALDTVMP